MNGHPETHRARSERVPKVAASVPMELGCVALPGCMGSRSWKLSEPRAFGISRSFLPQARSGVNSTPSPLPSLQDGAGAEGSTLLSTLGLSGDSPHPGAASAEPEMLLVPLSLRNLQGFRSSVQRPIHFSYYFAPASGAGEGPAQGAGVGGCAPSRPVRPWGGWCVCARACRGACCVSVRIQPRPCLGCVCLSSVLLLHL